MFDFLHLNLRELPDPSLNKIAIVSIDFVALSLLFIVFRSSKFRDIKSRIFSAMVFFILTWINFAYLARVFGFYQDTSLALLKIAWLATPPVFYTAYLTLIYVIKKDQNYKLVSRILFVITLILSLSVLLTDWIIKGTKFSQSILDIVYGLGFFPFLFLIFVIMFFTLLPLVRIRLTKSAQAFLVGVIIFYIANMTFNILLPVFFNVTYLYFLGDYSTIFLLGFTTYAIVRHELFDIKVIATEILTIIIWIILFSKLFIAQSTEELIVDVIIFGIMILLGLLLIRSVNREVKQREKLEELTEKLKELSARKDEFVSVAAHELRAPMTAIKGYLSMIMEGDTGKINGKLKEFLTEAALGNDRLIRLVTNLLNISRIEEGRLTFDMGDVHLGEVVQTSFKEHSMEAQSKKLSYKLEFAKGISDLVHVDKDRIYEVVGNFIGNAIKYTDTGSVSVRLYNSSSEFIRFEVIDTGPGIAKDEQDQIFKKFYRASSNSGKVFGTGLGLYVSKLLIQKFGGKTGFDSEVGKGSTFWFELPIKK